jgi:hypothetical protein
MPFTHVAGSTSTNREFFWEFSYSQFPFLHLFFCINFVKELCLELNNKLVQYLLLHPHHLVVVNEHKVVGGGMYRT